MTDQLLTKPTHEKILTLNSGSLSIKLAFFEADDSLRRILKEWIEMPDRQISAKVCEYLHNWIQDIRWRSNHPTQYSNKILLEISS